MKKLSLISAVLCAILSTSAASAKDGFYAGADLVISNAKYKYHDKKGWEHSNPVGKVDGNGVGASIAGGYKKSFDQVFIAPEIFYDYLNSSTKDYYHTIAPYQQDSLEIRARYGAKANLGYDFGNKISTYLTAGLANVNYVNRWPSSGDSESQSILTPIYGLGALFQINDSWAVKAEFNQQKFHTRHSIDSSVNYTTVISKVTLNVLKTGLVYSF